MTERRPLSEGLKTTVQEIDPDLAQQFVYGPKAAAINRNAPTPQAFNGHGGGAIQRVPISTRIRSDFAVVLKRASLERQLSGTNPHTLIDILEEALEPWLRDNGYLP